MQKPKALFICGSRNQTTQLHAIARELPEVEAWFSPYYVDGVMEACRRLGLIEMTIAGRRWSDQCRRYLRIEGLRVDERGQRGGYDLVVTAQDAFVPNNVRGRPMVLSQEGMTDPEGFAYHLVKLLPFLPRWFASTSTMGLSDAYARFCVASEGYRELFVAKGCDPRKLVVTGMPNFDHLERYRDNQFPHRDYVLVCTSDGRETFKRDDRASFLERCRRIAQGRAVIFKLHPNERVDRATREIRNVFPAARVFVDGSAEEMVANCETLIVEYSTLAFVGLGLGKQVFSHHDPRSLRSLMPWQNEGTSATRIADVCREVAGLEPARPATVLPLAPPRGRARRPVSAA